MSDADSSPPGAAETIYGRDGPISGGPADPRVRAQIEAGIARPAGQPGPRSLLNPDRAAADQRPAQLSTAKAMVGSKAAEGAPAFDPGKVEIPEGFVADPGLMQEFGAAAKEIGLSQEHGAKLMELHKRSLEAQNKQLHETWASWRATSERDFGNDLPAVLSDIEHAIGDGADARRFYELIEWSGLGSEPTVLKVLHRLAGYRRYDGRN